MSARRRCDARTPPFLRDCTQQHHQPKLRQQRHISPETFARLVRDTWVGSTGDATVLLRQVLGIRDTDADLVLAVDEPAGEPSANT